MSATSTDPARARVTATWMARLSPGLQRTVKAGPATRAPDHAGFTRRCIRRAPDSPRVAAPSSSASATTSWVMGRDPTEARRTSLPGGLTTTRSGKPHGAGTETSEAHHGLLAYRSAGRTRPHPFAPVVHAGSGHGRRRPRHHRTGGVHVHVLAVRRSAPER